MYIKTVRILKGKIVKKTLVNLLNDNSIPGSDPVPDEPS